MSIVLKSRSIPFDEAEYRLQVNTILSDSGCLLWTGHSDKDGYGLATFGQTTFRANRLAYAVSIYPEQLHESAVVCHHCDNPACVEPRHLYAGTYKSNGEDKSSRNRSARNINPQIGRNNGRAILWHLPDVDVLTALAEGGWRTIVAAKTLGVHPSSLSRYLNMKKLAYCDGRGGSPSRQWTPTEASLLVLDQNLT